MGLMDKFKNLFTEEVEEEIEEPIKKEVMQVEIPSPVRRSNPETEPVIAKEEPAIEPEPKKEEYKFPFFDDDDFSTIESDVPKKTAKKKSSYRKDVKEVYSPPREEKKVFKPTPIISPVYGILDQNYQKEDIRKKNERPRSYYDPKEATVDEIRNKAYGTLEDDIETTLFGHSRVLLEDELDKPEENNDEVLDNIETTEILTPIVNEEEDIILSADLMGDKPRHGDENSETEITDLLEEELGKKEILDEEPVYEEKTTEPRKISDAELLDMIDSMYQKGDK